MRVTMGKVQDICKRYDIRTLDGFEAAMKEMRGISEGELRFILCYESGGQSRAFKEQQVLAKSEMERREFLEKRKLTFWTWLIGFSGVIMGAALQALL